MLDPAKDAATQQTAAGYPLVKTMDTRLEFTKEETAVLRRLGEEVAEIAQRPEMAEKAALWTAHNDLKTDRPPVFIDPENGWNEMIPAHTLQCTDPLARVWEMALRKKIYWAKELKDDRVIDTLFDVPYSYTDTGWGVELKKERTSESGSYIVDPAIEDFETDFEKVHHPEIVMDWKESEILMQLAHNVFDGVADGAAKQHMVVDAGAVLGLRRSARNGKLHVRLSAGAGVGGADARHAVRRQTENARFPGEKRLAGAEHGQCVHGQRRIRVHKRHCVCDGPRGDDTGHVGFL